MKVQISKELEYVPEWNDNKQEADPVMVVLQPLTSEQRAACIEYRIDKDGEVNVVPDVIKLFRYGVKEVRNLQDDKPLTKAKDVLNSRANKLDGLVREVGSHVFVLNTVTDSKNLQ